MIATRSHRAVRTALVATLGASAMALALTAPAEAKEVASGGTPVPVATACSPVSSLTAKSDPKVGETGLASTAVSYGVKPCVNGQAVSVHVTVTEYLNSASVAYDYANAPVNGKFTVFGIKLRTTYVVTVAVSDALSGAALGSLSTYTAAVPKPV